MLPPPAAFKMKLTSDPTGLPMIVIDQLKASIMKYVFLLFIPPSLGINGVLLHRAYGMGFEDSESPNIFFLQMIFVATVNFVAIIAVLYRFFRPTAAQTLVFSRPGLIFDSGLSPFPVRSGMNSKTEVLERMFERRKVIEFTPKDIATLSLQKSELRNRLTLDHGKEKIEIGRDLTEVEREWLYEQLRKEYGLA